MYAESEQSLEQLKMIYGGRFDFWRSHVKIVEAFIKENNISPETVPIANFEIIGRIGTEQTSNLQTKELREFSIPKYLRPIIFPGGIRLPHLHLNGNVYILTENQWKDFSEKIVRGFQEKLAKVKAVDFGQLMDLADAVDRIPGMSFY